MARIPAAERRAELVAAAVRVIAADGVDGATTRRIAQEANAPLATLHYCFATKEVLFAAVFEHVAGQYREVLTRNDVHGDVAITARALLRGVMEWYLANPDFGAAIVELISWGQRQEGQQAEMVYNEASATMRAILETAATAAGRPVDPDTIDAADVHRVHIVGRIRAQLAGVHRPHQRRNDRSNSPSACSTPGWPPTSATPPDWRPVPRRPPPPSSCPG